MRTKWLWAMDAVLGTVVAALLMLMAAPPPAYAQRVEKEAGEFLASAYNSWHVNIVTGNTATGVKVITVNSACVVLESGGKTICPFATDAPLLIDRGTSNSETLTPSVVSCAQNGPCSLTLNFAHLHGTGTDIRSGSFGLQEAINDAFASGGGLVTVAGAFKGTNSTITSAVVFGNVSIFDKRGGAPRFWNPTPTGAALAVPTTLTAQAACDSTHQFCSDASVAGSASWSGNLYGCVFYVDIMGNDGPCGLASTVFTSVASKAIDIAAPVASPGAVGWGACLSLSGGTYAQCYKIPPTASNGTLTKLETTTAAWAVANATYGQAASTFGADALFTVGGAQIAGYPVNTGQHFTTLASVAMTSASQTPVSNSSVSYAYTPGNHIGLPGISPANSSIYAASGSSATTVPNAIATWTIPAGAFNYIGAEFRVTGKWTYTDGGDSSTHVYVKWDAPGTNTTTVGTTLCDILDTATGTAAAYNGTYTCTVKIISTGATGTALVNGYSTQNLAAGATTLVRNGADIAVAASGSINLTGEARIAVYFIGVGATNNPGAQGLEATLEALN